MIHTHFSRLQDQTGHGDTSPARTRTTRRANRSVRNIMLVLAVLLATAFTWTSSTVAQQSGSEQILPPDILNELFRDLESELGPALADAAPSNRSEERDRRAGPFERLHRSQLRKYAPLLTDAKSSIVRIDHERTTIAMGTVVDSDGLLVTKASEILDKEELRCHFSNGTSFEPEVIGIDQAHDVALLRVPASDLSPINWSTDSPSIGSLVVCGDEMGTPFASGVISVESRVLIDTNQAVLGVIPQPADHGVLIESVAPESAASRADLRPGDVILSIGDQPMTSVVGLTNHIRRHQPGEEIEIRFERDGAPMTVRASLEGRNTSGAFSQDLQEMNRFGAEPSQRRTNFPQVMQHDTPLWPEQCGSPLIDLSGSAVGINIARGSRVESYAIPAAVIQQIVQELSD